ncbi:MAG: modC [Enterovirga sp.]|nr:modC [Enterovirga sp.]
MKEGLTVDLDHRQGSFRLQAAFDAPPGVTALFGRSGSGKTTLANIVAGLVRPDRGRVSVGGTLLIDTNSGVALPRHRRRIGYVFQEARLFPHLSVRQNLLFGRWFAPRAEAGAEFGSILDLLGLGQLLARRPAGLSGGEKQRVAIGRALLAKPRLLLMDEPLASLDEARKAEILPFLERLRDDTRVPIVYVSHSLPEVVRLADTVVVLDEGRVTAAGAAGEILSRLDLFALSGPREAGAVLAARVLRHDPAFGLTTLGTPAGEIHVPQTTVAVGSTLRVQVHARDVMVSLTRPDRVSALNILAGTVAEIGNTLAGESSLTVRLDCSGAPLLARLTRKSVAELGLSVGMPIFAVVKSVAFETSHRPPAVREG